VKRYFHFEYVYGMTKNDLRSVFSVTLPVPMVGVGADLEFTVIRKYERSYTLLFLLDVGSSSSENRRARTTKYTVSNVRVNCCTQNKKCFKLKRLALFSR